MSDGGRVGRIGSTGRPPRYPPDRTGREGPA